MRKTTTIIPAISARKMVIIFDLPSKSGPAPATKLLREARDQFKLATLVTRSLKMSGMES